MACNRAPPRLDPTYTHLRTREPPLYEMPHTWLVWFAVISLPGQLVPKTSLKTLPNPCPNLKPNPNLNSNHCLNFNLNPSKFRVVPQFLWGLFLKHLCAWSSYLMIWLMQLYVQYTKKGNKSDLSNYRPITLTGIPCKIIKGFIRDYKMKCSADNNLFHNN